MQQTSKNGFRSTKANTMKFLLTLVIICFSHLSSSQGLECIINNDGELSFVFDSSFIQSKKIKLITSTFSKKKPNQTVKPLTKNSKEILYNKDCQISETKSRTYIASTPVKKHKKYLYVNSILSQTVTLDQIGYYSEFSSYAGDSCFIQVFRSDDYTSLDHRANDSTFITSKVLITTPTSIRELNSKGIEVNKTTITYDSLGLKKREFTQHTFSPLLIDKHYDYNLEGNVSEIELTTITARKNYRFIYDNLSALQTIEYYLNDVLITKHEVVYNSDGWVSAFLKHDVDSHIIEIEKLDYTFYE